MITETRFALSHHAFWHDLLPMAEQFTRSINDSPNRFESPLQALEAPALRGVVNELAFRLFVRAERGPTSPSSLPGEAIADELASTRTFISSFRQHGRGPLPALGNRGVLEAIKLAQRTQSFFAAVSARSLVLQPMFPGCGWVSECQGDVYSDAVLYEVKSGERAFRSSDIRQLLVYCALNYASKAFPIHTLCLVNPRSGTFVTESLNAICETLSGRPATEVLADVVEYVSGSTGEYGTV